MRSTEQAERIEFTLAFLNSEWGKTAEVDRQEFIDVVYSWAILKAQEAFHVLHPNLVSHDLSQLQDMGQVNG